MTFTAYHAPKGFAKELVHELEHVTHVRDHLVLASGPPQASAWAQNIWFEPEFISINSISHAAKTLRDVQRNWCLCSIAHHRRAKLIQEKLPKVSAKRHVFGEPVPMSALGAWTLWAPNTILASPSCSSPFPNGACEFVEDKTTPPNRAYLKLWDLFTRLEEIPEPGQLCLDLGSSPGGWSWVLQGLGARVYSVDKAPLATHIERLPGVEHCLGSAFGLDPRHVGEVDWLFSDIICYPSRLLQLVQRWLELGACRRFVCTVKFQGETDHETVQRFAEIPGSRLLHLYHNKHELTWVKLS